MFFVQFITGCSTYISERVAQNHYKSRRHRIPNYRDIFLFVFFLKKLLRFKFLSTFVWFALLCSHFLISFCSVYHQLCCNTVTFLQNCYWIHIKRWLGSLNCLIPLVWLNFWKFTLFLKDCIKSLYSPLFESFWQLQIQFLFLIWGLIVIPLPNKMFLNSLNEALSARFFSQCFFLFSASYSYVFDFETPIMRDLIHIHMKHSEQTVCFQRKAIVFIAPTTISENFIYQLLYKLLRF